MNSISSKAFFSELEKISSKMGLEWREALPSKSFAVPISKAKKFGVLGKIKGKARGSYPIPDKAHARNALARVSQHGTPAEREAVRRKVYAKFPELKAGFKARHGGESPTAKGHVKKVEQGGIGKKAFGRLSAEEFESRFMKGWNPKKRAEFKAKYLTKKK